MELVAGSRVSNTMISYYDDFVLLVIFRIERLNLEIFLNNYRYLDFQVSPKYFTRRRIIYEFNYVEKKV